MRGASEIMSTDAEHPWRKSKSGNVYCRWNDVPERIRASLIREDKTPCKICELNGYLDLGTKWQKSGENCFPHVYDKPGEPYTRLRPRSRGCNDNNRYSIVGNVPITEMRKGFRKCIERPVQVMEESTVLPLGKRFGHRSPRTVFIEPGGNLI